jgi:hypothetical protein
LEVERATQLAQRERRLEGRDVRCEYAECRRDDEVIMATSRLQAEPASRARLEDELSKLFAQKLAAGRTLGDRQLSAPDGSAEPLNDSTS